MSSTATPWNIPENYKDRRVLLMILGCVIALGGLLALGLLALVLTTFIRMGAMMSAAAGSGNSYVSMMIVNVCVWYGGPGVVLLTLGLGSMMLKRWSRPLILIVSWLSLYWGIVWLFMIGILLGTSDEFRNTTGGDPYFGVVMLIGGAITVIGFVCVPALNCFCYALPSVKQTFERCDPKPRWTDRCPIPVLALALVLIAMAIVIPLYLMRLQKVPAFGAVHDWSPLTIAGSVLGCLALAWTAWRCYRLRIDGWVLAVLLVAGFGVNYYLTIQNLTAEDTAQVLGFPEEEIGFDPSSTSTEVAAVRRMYLVASFSLIPVLLYILWLVRYFIGSRSAKTPPPSAPGANLEAAP